jgi:hypothetical protein
MSKLLIPRPGVLDPGGALIYRQRRGGQVIASGEVRNMVVTEGKNDFLATVFNAQQSQGLQSLQWWLGIVDGPSFSSFDVSDSLASHPGWTQFTQYIPSLPSLLAPLTATSRGYWYRNAASGGQMLGDDTADSGDWVQFTNSSTTTVQGIFVTTDRVRSGTSGIIWATCPFASPLSVNGGDILNLIYSVTL